MQRLCLPMSMSPTRTKTKKTGPPLKQKKNLSHTRSTLANVSKYKCIPSQHFGQWPLAGKQFRQSNLKTKHDQFIVWYISKCGYCEGLKKKKSEMIKNNSVLSPESQFWTLNGLLNHKKKKNKKHPKNV